jgi:hypothetical protein
MRLFCGLISLFIIVYNIAVINPFITDIIAQSRTKSITNHLLKLSRGYFRIMNRGFITEFIREESRRFEKNLHLSIIRLFGVFLKLGRVFIDILIKSGIIT